MSDWQPARADAFWEGTLGDDVRNKLAMETTIGSVFSVPETWVHVAQRHATQIDVSLARSLVASVLNRPDLVYRSRQRPDSILLAGRYDFQHYLVVVVKVLQKELWLATVYRDRDYNVLARAKKSGVILRRE